MAVRAGGSCRSANNKGGALASPLACEIIGMMMGVSTAATATTSRGKSQMKYGFCQRGEGGAEHSRAGPPLTSSPTLPTEAAEGRET